MLPDPLHPAVVHFPIVLMFILPVAAFGALWIIRRGTPARLPWAVPVAVAAALALSAWAAVQTGERQGERAEDAVGEGRVEQHEEMAERFLALSSVLLVVTAAGLAGGLVGRVARVLGTVGACAIIVVGYQVGHSGGSLVYGDATAPGLVTGAIGAGEAAGGEGTAAEGRGGRETDD